MNPKFKYTPDAAALKAAESAAKAEEKARAKAEKDAEKEVANVEAGTGDEVNEDEQ